MERDTPAIAAAAHTPYLNGLLAVVLAEGLAVVQSLGEDFRQLMLVILAIVLRLSVLQQHLHFRYQQSIGCIKIYRGEVKSG